MMRATIYSNDKKTFEFTDDENGAVLKIGSLWEAAHFAGVGYHLVRLAKKDKLPDPADEVHEQVVEEQPFYLGIGPFRFRLD